jgi:hypothetical protein
MLFPFLPHAALFISMHLTSLDRFAFANLLCDLHQVSYMFYTAPTPSPFHPTQNFPFGIWSLWDARYKHCQGTQYLNHLYKRASSPSFSEGHIIDPSIHFLPRQIFGRTATQPLPHLLYT